jgi:hypothetical protein
MSANWTLIFGVVTLLASLEGFRRFSAADKARLQKLDKWSRVYARAMRKIVEKSDLPDELIDALQFWNKVVADKAVSRKLLKALTLAHSRVLSSSAETGGRAPLHSFLSQNVEVENLYVEIVVSAMLTISYRSVFWGMLIRSMMSEIFAERRPKTIERFSSAAKKELTPFRRDEHDCLVGA